VLFGQEVLHTSTCSSALIDARGVGGVLGGWLGSRIARRIGAGASVQLTMWSGGVCVLLARPRVAVAAGRPCCSGDDVHRDPLERDHGELAHAVIPDRLLGRVNSVYRFFGWGMMPIGSLIGGALVAVLDGPLSREWALRDAVDRGRRVPGSSSPLVVVRSLSSSRIDAGAGRRQGGGLDVMRSRALPDSLEQALRTGGRRIGRAPPTRVIVTWVLRVFVRRRVS
jgi:hypothetical protein